MPEPEAALIGSKPTTIALARDDSTKPTTNPKSSHHRHPQRVSSANLKAAAPNAKTPILGLPNKIQHYSGQLGQSARRTRHQRIFPKNKKGVKVSDPGSPKVSCFGKVLLAPEKNRRRRPRRCWERLAAVFRRRKASAAVEKDIPSPVRNISARERKESAAAVPGLGGMRRFASGRRAASWGGVVEAGAGEVEEGHVAWSGPLDRT